MASQHTPLSDEALGQLLKQVAAGGQRAESAVAALYRQWRAPVLAHLRLGGLDAEAAEDTLHDVFVKLAQRAGQWRGEGSASAWFWVIVRRARIDHFRAHADELTLDEDGWAVLADAMPAAAGVDAAGDLQGCVGEALQRFARAHPERADAIRLLLQEQWGIAEVAQYLGRTPGATRQFLSQCRKAFKSFVVPCLAWLSPEESP